MEWQPIETAPKDGTIILAAWAGEGPASYGVIRWDEDCWMEGGGPRYWCEVSEFTHWMPLPPPPEAVL